MTLDQWVLFLGLLVTIALQIFVWFSMRRSDRHVAEFFRLSLQRLEILDNEVARLQELIK